MKPMKETPRRGRLLFLAPVLPANHGNGLAMRVGFFLDAYSHRFDVDLAVFAIAAVPKESTAFTRPRVRRIQVFSRPLPDAHFALVAAMGNDQERLLAFRRYGRPSLASITGESARRALHGWMASHQYDVVHVSRLYLAPLTEAWPAAAAAPRFVIDCDEDDANAYRRLAQLERKNGRHRQADWAEAEADAFDSLARKSLPRFDLAFSASATEAASLSNHAATVVVVPNVAPAGSRYVRQPRPRLGKAILCVGTMGYAPNDDGVRWLITRIWPGIRRALRASVRLLIVGSNPSPSLVRLGRRRDVTVTGTVRDIGTFYRDADLAVIPIRAGGGTRIKLLEAAAHGTPIVSTTFGAAGTTLRHGRDLLIADDEEQFARACVNVLRRPHHARALAARARRRAVLDYNSEQWAGRVTGLISDLVFKTGSGMSERGHGRCRKS